MYDSRFQLYECAKRAKQRLKLGSCVDDISGLKFGKLATYLRNRSVRDIKYDKAWLRLTDLRKLRNTIVHRAGARIDQQLAVGLEARHGRHFVSGSSTQGWCDFVGDPVTHCLAKIAT